MLDLLMDETLDWKWYFIRSVAQNKVFLLKNYSKSIPWSSFLFHKDSLT